MNLVFLILNEFIIGLYTASRILKIVKDKAKYRLMFRDFAIFLGTHLYLELTSTCAESFQKRFYFHFTHLAFTHTLRVFFFFSFSCFTFSALSLFLYLSAYNLFSFEMLYLMAFCQKGRLKDTHVSALESLFISSFSQSCKTGERLVWQVEVIIGYFFFKNRPKLDSSIHLYL